MNDRFIDCQQGVGLYCRYVETDDVDGRTQCQTVAARSISTSGTALLDTADLLSQ